MEQIPSPVRVIGPRRAPPSGRREAQSVFLADADVAITSMTRFPDAVRIHHARHGRCLSHAVNDHLTRRGPLQTIEGRFLGEDQGGRVVERRERGGALEEGVKVHGRSPTHFEMDEVNRIEIVMLPTVDLQEARGRQRRPLPTGTALANTGLHDQQPTWVGLGKPFWGGMGPWTRSPKPVSSLKN